MDEGQFREALEWALMQRAPAAALIYRAEGGEEAFVPDPIVVELLDRGELKRDVPQTTWSIVKYSLHHYRTDATSGDESQLGQELAALG